MEKALGQGIFPGAVLLASGGDEIRYFKAFGVTDIVSKKTMQKNAVFDLASLTKPLSTAMAVFKLFEAGKVFLEQDLSSIMPAICPQDKSNITIEQLLNHTSGLPAHREYFHNLMSCKKGLRRDLLRELILKEPLIGKPGEKQVYSDLGFIILAWIVETLSGERINKFVTKNVYEPLGIDNLFFIDNPELFALGDKYEMVVPTENCAWRKKLLRAETHDDNAWPVGGIEGHAGLFGDASSVWQILFEIMNGLNIEETRALNSTLLLQFLEKGRRSEFRGGFDTPSKYGSSSGKYFSGASIGHLGYTGTSFWIDPEKSVIVVLLTNRVHPSRDNNQINRFRPEIHNLIMEKLL